MENNQIFYESKYQELTPAEYIRRLFADTKDGIMTVTYYPVNGEKPYDLTYPMNWTETDAKALVNKYEELTAILRKLGGMWEELESAEARKTLLTEQEASVWEAYLSPFEPFEVDESVIAELYIRGEFDTLEDEENELLERHFEWRERESLKHLPALGKNPADMILRARRYTKLVSMGAPEIVIKMEGHGLAEEMALYYYFDKEAKRKSVIDEIIDGNM